MRERQEAIRSRLPPETDGCGKWKREKMLQKIQNLEDKIQAMEARKADPQSPQRCGSRKWCHNDSTSCSAKNSCEKLEQSVKALRDKQDAIRASLPSEQDTKYCAVQKRACMLQKIQKIDDKIKFLEAKNAQQPADPQNPNCQGKKWCGNNDSTPCQ
jgi:BMFP domain-containing protein YqiC